MNPEAARASGSPGRGDTHAWLVSQLLAALRDESEALKRDDAARLAMADSRRRLLLRMLLSNDPGSALPLHGGVPFHGPRA